MTRCSRLHDWFTPPASPTPLRFNETTAQLLSQLGSPSVQVVDELLAGARASYDEATARAESAERRAATIQGAIAIAASLTVAGGSLLLDPANVRSQMWRIAIGSSFAIAVLLLAIAAWRAFLVTWPRFMWASPAALDTVDHAKEPSGEAIRLRRASDLLIAYGRNDSVARLKLALLGQAMRWLMSALAVLSVLAIMLAVYAVEHTSNNAKVPQCRPRYQERSRCRSL